MDPNKLTQKSQEALRRAHALAVRYGQQAFDGEHLLAALIQDQEGIVPRLIARTAVRPDVLANRVETALSKKPRVSGPGRDAEGVHMTSSLAELFDRAEHHAERLKDDFVSVEHL